MAIYDTNPDLPIPGQPFSLYQCPEIRNSQIAAQQASYWYNGQSLTPQTTPGQFSWGSAPQTDSRRYDAPAPIAAPQPTYGFNQLAESRRNAPAPQFPAQPNVQTIGSNPWAVQPASVPLQPENNYVNGMLPQYSSHFSFDRSSAWGDQRSYTAPIPPQINWGQPQPQQQTIQQNTAMVQMAYPSQPAQVPAVENWELMVAQNFQK
jgi:hypothetical protein